MPVENLLDAEERYVRLTRAAALLQAESESLTRQAMKLLQKNQRRRNNADETATAESAPSC